MGCPPLCFGFLMFALLLGTPGPQARSTPPYPPSQVITGITWDFPHLVRLAPGSDLWPMTWAADDRIYTSWGDGGGFGGTNSEGRVSLGFARISGPPTQFTTANVWGGKDAEHPATFGGKVAALLSVAGVLYGVGGVWPGKAGVTTWSSPHEARLLWSSDLGRSWQVSDWTFADEDNPAFAPVAFLNFSKDYAEARDGYVYLYGGSAWWVRTPARGSFLARVPKERIKDRAAYQYVAGLDREGAPAWTTAFERAQPVFIDPNGRKINKVIYHPALKRYLATASGAAVGQLGIFDAPEPWGPWTTVAYEDDWGHLGATEALEFDLPTKWISADGKTLWCVFSSTGVLDSFNLVKGTLTLPER
jgi:hypothetical protein